MHCVPNISGNLAKKVVDIVFVVLCYSFSVQNSKQHCKLSTSCSLYSSGHRCTSHWLSAVSSAWLILLEIPISTSWILQRPSKAKLRHPSLRRSSRHSVAKGALQRAKAALEDTAEESGEIVPIQGTLLSIQPTQLRGAACDSITGWIWRVSLSTLHGSMLSQTKFGMLHVCIDT